MLYSINWPNFIVWLPLLLEIFDMYIAIARFLNSDVINFEITPISLRKLFFYFTKNPRHKFKYLEKEKSFYDEIKSFFYQF